MYYLEFVDYRKEGISKNCRFSIVTVLWVIFLVKGMMVRFYGIFI